MLVEALGGETPFAERRATGHASDATSRSRWFAAALVIAAVGTAFGVALLRDEAADARPAQQPQENIEWHEAHGPASLAAIPAGVVNLRCFDFDDAACAKLRRFTKLERLDLSGADVNDKGYSIPPRTTDNGVRELGALKKLRWLCLARCHAMKGDGLQALEALPQLEHLDLTYSGVQTPAIERLPRLPSLRSLVMSHCLDFHGRALAAVASMPGLRRLELQGCATLAAKDVLHLVGLKELRHLDLRDCQGRFRGQTAVGLGEPDATDEPESFDPATLPVQDGIGITDDVVAALAELKLETLLLGGSESLTDAIGPSLAKMTTLRSLDLSNLPHATPALLAHLPRDLTSLALELNPALAGEALRALMPLSQLRELSLPDLDQTDDAITEAVLRGKTLHTLRIGDTALRDSDIVAALTAPRPTVATAQAIARQSELRTLYLANADWLNTACFRALAGMPALTELELAQSLVRSDHLTALAASKSLRSLRLTRCRPAEAIPLTELAPLPLRELSLLGTKFEPALTRESASKHWPGCLITLPDGKRFRTK
ncbi:MAG TPA: hypothetical protein VFT55_00350 [Planctomycetota bacterium]|nr:hypothetical protein [Planctomycetota bacterium]